MLRILSKKNIRIGFIGAGSIGSLFGGYLAEIRSDLYSIEVIFFSRKAHADEVNKNGLKLERNQQISVIRNIRAYENEKIFEAMVKQDPSFRFDFIFLTTKAYDSEAAIVQYKKVIDISSWLVILQNGIGNEEIVIPYCKESKIIRVVTTIGALLDKPGHVIHTGKGITKLGFPFLSGLPLKNQKLEEAKIELTLLNEILALAGFTTEIVEDIIKESWEKVLVNIGINALGALTRLPNGKLLEIKALKKDDSIIDISLSTSPVFNNRGDIIGAIGIMTDISDKKKIEEEKMQKMEQLETFQDVSIDREIRMIELKKEVNELLGKMGEKPKYKIAE